MRSTDGRDDDFGPDERRAVTEFQRHFHDDFEVFRAKIGRMAVDNNWSRSRQEHFAAYLVAALAGYLLASYAPGRLIQRSVFHAQDIGKAVKSAFVIAKDERLKPKMPLDRMTRQ